MKKAFVFVLLLFLLFSASACSSSNEPEVTDEEVLGSTFTCGNYVMTIPAGFTATKSGDLFFLSSDHGACSISIFALDVSLLDEDHVRDYVSSQSDAFIDEDATIYNKKTQEVRFGSELISMIMYIEEDADGTATLHTNGTFSDSWYGYTVSIQCPSGSDSISDFYYSFAEFCGYAEYIGEDPRFGFVQ